MFGIPLGTVAGIPGCLDLLGGPSRDGPAEGQASRWEQSHAESCRPGAEDIKWVLGRGRLETYAPRTLVVPKTVHYL